MPLRRSQDMGGRAGGHERRRVVLVVGEGPECAANQTLSCPACTRGSTRCRCIAVRRRTHGCAGDHECSRVVVVVGPRVGEAPEYATGILWLELIREVPSQDICGRAGPNYHRLVIGFALAEATKRISGTILHARVRRVPFHRSQAPCRCAGGPERRRLAACSGPRVRDRPSSARAAPRGEVPPHRSQRCAGARPALGGRGCVVGAPSARPASASQALSCTRAAARAARAGSADRRRRARSLTAWRSWAVLLLNTSTSSISSIVSCSTGNRQAMVKWKDCCHSTSCCCSRCSSCC